MRRNAFYDKISLDKLIKDLLIKEGKYSGEAKEKIDTNLIKHKREYRADLKKRNAKKYLYPNNYGEIVNGGGDYDSFWQKIFFAGEHWSEEEKQEFIEENWIHCEPSQYDCTGQTFTWAIDVFNVPSGVVAYIRDALDV